MVRGSDLVYILFKIVKNSACILFSDVDNNSSALRVCQELFHVREFIQGVFEIDAAIIDIDNFCIRLIIWIGIWEITV